MLRIDLEAERPRPLRQFRTQQMQTGKDQTALLLFWFSLIVALFVIAWYLPWIARLIHWMR